MKAVAYISLYWGDEFGKPPRLAEEKEQGEKIVREVLEHAGRKGKFRLDEFRSERQFCVLRIEVGSEAFNTLVEELQPFSPHLVRALIGLKKLYSQYELENAELLLWRFTNQAIEDDYYDLEVDGYQGGEQASHRRCLACRTELAQVRDLLVKTHKMGKRDLSLTYSFEVICSPRLIELFKDAGLTGFATRAVWDYRKSYQGEPPLFQLVVTNVLPPMLSPPTEFENIQHCEVCGRTSQYLKHTHWWGKIQYREETPIYYPRRVLEGAKDFNRTAEYFADLAVATPYVIISQRVYRLLREQKVKGWTVEPVYLVE